MIRGSATDRAGATVPVQSIKACVVYDAGSGRIHHHHRVLTLVGGYEPSEAEMEQAALHRVAARRSGHPGGTLEVLHIAHDAMHPGALYRVDVSKRALVAG